MWIISLAAGILGILNYAWWANTTMTGVTKGISLALQAILVLAALGSALVYRGRRNRPSYDGAGYSIWTLRFAVIMVSLAGNIIMLVVLGLGAAGVIGIG